MARPAIGQVVTRKGKRGVTYGLRFRAYGSRHYTTAAATTHQAAELELADVLADVRRGIWQPPQPAVEPLKTMQTFHEFSRAWIARKESEGLKARTIADYRWALELHLLPEFADLPLDQITKQRIDDYKAYKVEQRKAIDAARVRAEANGETFTQRGLSNNMINKTLVRLSQILGDAVEYELVGANAAAGKRRRLKAERPRRPYVEVEQLMFLLEASESLLFKRGRPMLATMAGAGLRIQETLDLRWRDVSLDRGTLSVGKSKTDAGVRSVDLTPALRDELREWQQRSRFVEAHDLVFPTNKGKADTRHNARRRLLLPAIEKANVELVKAGIDEVDSIGFHGLRRTFASLWFAVGDDPVYTAEQIGHESAEFTMRVYAAAVKRRSRLTPAELESFDRACEWARMGTISQFTPAEAPATLVVDQKKTRLLQRVS
jgi:integrase